MTANKKVRYPFGYGLSYTMFDYKNMQVNETEDTYKVSCEITNSGNYDGAEIVQLYVKASKGVYKPIKELKGFTKVYLKTGESKKVEIVIKKDDLRYWNIAENKWITEGGEYELQLCSDCQTVKLSQLVTLVGETAINPYTDEVNEIYASAKLNQVTDSIFEQMSGMKIPALPKKKPVTLESRFTYMQGSFLGRVLYNAVLGVSKKDLKKAKKLPEGIERDNRIKSAIFLKRILDSNSLISLSMSAGKSMPYNFAQGFANLANGNLIKGIRCFCTKIKVPKLPKDKEDK